MSDTNNPYSAPNSRVDDPAAPEVIVPASRGRRFANLLVDYVAFLLVSVVIGIFLGISGYGRVFTDMGVVGRDVYGVGLMFAYYFGLEATTGRTLGKMVTGTIVVNEEGGKITPRQAALRTLCRFIPFEAFSFFSSNARGWHDSLPHTYVVMKR
jgi:uncharacterized RDD family membrane protein YckC